MDLFLVSPGEERQNCARSVMSIASADPSHNTRNIFFFSHFICKILNVNRFSLIEMKQIRFWGSVKD